MIVSLVLVLVLFSGEALDFGTMEWVWRVSYRDPRFGYSDGDNWNWIGFGLGVIWTGGRTGDRYSERYAGMQCERNDFLCAEFPHNIAFQNIRLIIPSTTPQ